MKIKHNKSTRYIISVDLLNVHFARNRNIFFCCLSYLDLSLLATTVCYTFCCSVCVDFLDLYEGYHVSSWRQQALDHIYEHVCADDEFTQCISIGPVSTIILQQ